MALPSGGASLKDHAISNLFKGHLNMLDEIQAYDGSPNGALTSDFQGQLCWDYTNGYWYINTYTSTTTWVRVG